MADINAFIHSANLRCLCSLSVLHHKQNANIPKLQSKRQHQLHGMKPPTPAVTIRDRTLTILQGSYASALSINDLKKLSTNPDLEIFDPDLQLTYGSFEGSLRLRQRIAELHSSEERKLTPDNVIITPGSIMANYLILNTICGPGDHIICQYPTFGQLYSLPKFSGVDVGLWKMDEKNGWMPSIDELTSMIKPSTKAIILKWVYHLAMNSLSP